jgi:regulator of replication initiation timing
MLNILEEKLIKLLDLIKDLKGQIKVLQEENVQLQQQLTSLEGSKQEGNKQVDELEKEKELAKVFIDDLIENIDSIIENESNHDG